MLKISCVSSLGEKIEEVLIEDKSLNRASLEKALNIIADSIFEYGTDMFSFKVNDGKKYAKLIKI